MLKLLISSSVFFILGVSLGWYFFSDSNDYLQECRRNLNVASSKLETLKNSVSKIGNIDLAEYLDLKSNRERYEKADEILGKIIVLFLANVELHLNAKVEEYISKPLKVRMQRKDISVNKGNEEKLQEKEIGLGEFDTGKDKFIERESAKKLKNNSKKITMFSGSWKRKLEAAVYDDPMILARSKAIKKGEGLLFHKLQGDFAGNILIGSGEDKGLLDQVYLSVNFDFIDDKLEGECSIRMLRDGHTYINSTSRGVNSKIRYLKNEKRGIIIKVNGETYFQLLYIKSRDFFMINYYVNFKHVGTGKIYRY